MIVAINDLPFEYQFVSKYHAVEKIREWMQICKRLESEECSKVHELFGKEINKEVEIAPGYKLIQLLKEFETQDDRRYMIHLLMNLNTLETPEEAFRFDGRESYICSKVGDGFVVSVVANEEYRKEVLEGVVGTEKVPIKNISQNEHFEIYKYMLGIRKYEANPKHRSKPYVDKAGRYVDAMDMTDAEAQKLLNQAIEIDGKLYGKRKGKYYCFQNHLNNCYHGYENDELDEGIRNKIDRVQWES